MHGALTPGQGHMPQEASASPPSPLSLAPCDDQHGPNTQE